MACTSEHTHKKARTSHNGSSKLITDSADILWDKNKMDSAFLMFDQARENAAREKDTFYLAVALSNMGMIATELGDSFNGQEYSIEALKFLQEGDTTHRPYILANLNNLGISSYDLKKYDASIGYYQQSLRLITDSAHLHTAKNNLANAYRQNGQYGKAIQLYGEVLEKDTVLRTRARTMTNKAYAQWLADPTYNPSHVYRQALSIRERIGDLWGQNSSYSHLSNYYLNTQPDSALHYSRLLYGLATKLRNPDNALEALGKLTELEPSRRLAYFRRYRLLDDSLTSARNAAKNQFALIRYQTEKHKADKIRLEQDNEQKKAQIAKRNALLALAAVAILAITTLSVTIYRHRKKRMAAEAEKEIRESKLKTSKEIHDVVANGLYRIMSSVEYSQSLDRLHLIGQIEKLYQQSRQISHAVSTDAMDFMERIQELIHSFSSPTTKILSVGLSDHLNTHLSMAIKEELILALQELLVNMRKHSNASQVVLRFALSQKQFEMHYRDNGIGIQEHPNDGLGLRNTESRIAALKGRLIFGNHGTGGVQATITIPIT